MKLYHYTTSLHLDEIIDHGSLWKGDIPLTKSMRIGQEGNAVWLTTCAYAKRGDHGLSSPICDKSEIRFTVDIKDDDPRLFKWSEYARLNKVEKSWYNSINSTGGGLADTWWLFMSPITVAGLKVAQKFAGQYVDIQLNQFRRTFDVQNTM